MGGLFPGLFLCDDHENQSHFASLRQDFFLNSIEIFTIFAKIPLASDRVKIGNSQNYEHSMELKPVFFVNVYP